MEKCNNAPKYLNSCTKLIWFSLKNTVELSQCLLTVHLKNMVDNSLCKHAEDKLTIHRSSAYDMWLMRFPQKKIV